MFSSMQSVRNKFLWNIKEKNLNDFLQVAVPNNNPDNEILYEEIK